MVRGAIAWVRLALLIALIGLLLPGYQVAAEEPEASFALGLIPSPRGSFPRLRVRYMPASLPAAVDLSAGLPPVGRQGGQASCVGWAIAYYYRSFQEGRENARTPRTPQEILSPAYIYNQRPMTDCSRDGGMSMISGLRIAVSQGVATLDRMPYDAADTCAQPDEHARTEAQLYRSVSYINLFNTAGKANLALLKYQLSTGDPFLLGLPVYSEFLRTSSLNPVIDVPAVGSNLLGGHAVLVVGYDDATQTFKFVNSWGENWADHGFGYLTYRFVQQRAWEGWILVDADTTPPTLPDHALELSGIASEAPQGEVDAPTFVWERAQEPTATYQVYWGANPEGEDDKVLTDPLFGPEPISENGTYYLRVNAADAAGNQTDWRTLFTFCYEANQEDGQTLGLPPLLVN